MNPVAFMLRCFWCKSEYAPQPSLLTCPKCGGALEATYDLDGLSGIGALPVTGGLPGIWRYARLFPITATTPLISLGEGQTPLTKTEKIAKKLGMTNLLVKDETRNPTLSFKDRKSSVGISKALEFGAKGVGSMTAGNAGSSIAAYAAKAEIPAYIFTVRGVSDSKIAKLVSYGAHVFKSETTSTELLKFVRDFCKSYGLLNLTAASRYNPYIKEGAKTAVFEIFEEMKGLPDWIVLPIGGGGNLASYFKGLRELKAMGLIERFPKLVGVQGKFCAPVVEAFERKLEPKDVPTIANAHTIAHSIFDDWAPDGDQALVAIRETGGTAVGVTDEEIQESMKWMSGMEGMFVEPSSATPLSALRSLLAQGTVQRDESVVLVATGFGSNQPEAAIEAWGVPPTIGMDLAGMAKYMKSG